MTQTSCRRPGVRRLGATAAAAAVLSGSLVSAPVPAGAGGATAAQQLPTQFVLKVLRVDGCSIEGLAARYRFVVDDALLSSQRIYRAHPAAADSEPDPSKRAQLVRATNDAVARDACVGFSELDTWIALSDDQFHSWTPDPPQEASSSEWRRQEARSVLALDSAHELSTGQGAVVAVLDTGVDATHQVLAGHVGRGYDFVDDDARPDDLATGTDSDGDGVVDGGVGHGTFVAGLVLMTAPDARVLPYRVLDSDGNGTVFSIAEGVLAAVADGADVINLSLGTGDKVASTVIKRALDVAKRNGVLVVAAAGNDGSKKQQYPASVADVMAVAATRQDNQALAAFSNRGGWVDVAAPGVQLVGPLPGARFARWSGTSVSAPLVAGQAALLRGMGPSVARDRIVEAIDRTCSKIEHAEMKDGRIDLTGSLSFLQAKLRHRH